jgi:hypothetical protein
VTRIRGSGKTVTSDVAVSAPLAVVSVADTDADPALAPVNDVVAPDVGETLPMPDGVTDQTAPVAGVWLPYESTARAVSTTPAPEAFTVAWAGVTASATSGPGVTVTVWVVER